MFDFLFAQYSEYPTHQIFLEITAVFFGLLSVWYAKKNNILVFPTGLISTAIYVYLLWKWGLLGDMTINIYYVIMSFYGWYHWSRKKNEVVAFPISTTTKKEQLWAWSLFFASMIFVVFIYNYFDKFTSWTAYVDTLTTGIFFAAMWLMAKRKLENWILWIIADAISIPLYFYKGLTFSSFQFILFTIIAILGYKEWKRFLQKTI